MANYRYNRYQYETSPRKLQPEYEQPKERYSSKKTTTVKKETTKIAQKKQVKFRIKTVACICFIFASLFVISYRNSQINQSFNENEKIKSDLAAIQKQNEQLKVSLENSLNLSNIEKVAKEKGMQKLDNSQKVYVSLNKQDYVEAASEEVIIEDDTNWLQKFLNTLLGKKEY